MKKLFLLVNLVLVSIFLFSFVEENPTYQYYSADGVLITTTSPPKFRVPPGGDLSREYFFEYYGNDGGGSSSVRYNPVIASATIQREVDGYASYWAPWTSSKTHINHRRYDLKEEYDKSVNFMVGEVASPFTLEPGEVKTVEFEAMDVYSISEEVTQNNVEENSSKVMGEINSGFGIFLDILELKEQVSISVEQSTVITNSISHSYSWSGSHSVTKYETETYTNPLSDYQCLVYRGFRQAYKVYPCELLEYQYDITETRSGLFGKDATYTYHIKDIVHIEDYYILVPISDPYYTISYYSYNENNAAVYIGNTLGSNFIYI